jgi:hypothetical protein
VVGFNSAAMRLLARGLREREGVAEGDAVAPARLTLKGGAAAEAGAVAPGKAPRRR